MLFYPSKTQDKLNRGKPFYPERLTGRAMYNPIYWAREVAPGARVICDSGAFQDLGTRPRPQPWQALERQLRYERQLQMLNPSFDHFEAVVIYDEMAGVDEAIIDGRKVKVRGTEETAERAVAETLRSAAYYASQRHQIAGALCFAGQGINPQQYVADCVRPMMDVMQPGDWFAFGGFCIIGRQRRLVPVFYETFEAVLDVLIPFGIRRYHLLGVGAADVVEYAAAMAERRGVVLSNDTSAVEVASVAHGAEYVNGRWTKGRWTRADKGVAYCPVDLAHRNIVAYSAWALSLGGNGYDTALDDEERAQIRWAHARGLDPVTLAPICEEAA